MVFLIPERGIDLVSGDYRRIPILSKPLIGGGIWRKLIFSFSILPSFFQSLRILLREKPNVLIGTGGYASFIPIVAGFVLRIPTAIQEQNVMPGLTTRVLARIVDRVFVSYKETGRWLPPRNLLVTGNPVRKMIGQVYRAEATKYFGLDRNCPTVLILGGSRGAHSINCAFVELLDLLSVSERIQFIALTGKEDLNWVKRRAESKPFKTIVFDFLTQIEYAYAASDLVISRAGATTISELLVCAKPSIVVPYPYAGEHQKFNASLLEKNEAAVVIQDRMLSGEVLKNEILKIIRDQSTLQRMEENARKLAKAGAAKIVAEEIGKCSGI